MKTVSSFKSVTLVATSICLLMLAVPAVALTTCSISSPGFLAGYDPTNVTTSITSTTFDVTCTRDNGAGPATVTVQYQVAANNGINASGTQNRAALSGSFLNYNLTTDPACATPWKGATVIPTPAASFTIAKNSTVTSTATFYGCIPPGQVVLPPEGTYTDTVTMTFSLAKAQGQNSFTGGAFPVSIIAPATCTITTPPSNVAFSYTAFSTTAVLANASIGLQCTKQLAYTLTLDAADGVVAGLNYSLGMNTTANSGGTNPFSGVGIGTPQTVYINGTLAAGQAGACSATNCNATDTRTLTVTY